MNELLTGKALEDFEKVYPPIGRSEVYEYALIIYWLDSVGIYISIEFIFDYGFQSYVENIETTTFTNIFNTRQEATRQAIIKANEIYNIKESN